MGGELPPLLYSRGSHLFVCFEQEVEYSGGLGLPSDLWMRVEEKEQLSESCEERKTEILGSSTERKDERWTLVSSTTVWIKSSRGLCLIPLLSTGFPSQLWHTFINTHSWHTLPVFSIMKAQAVVYSIYCLLVHQSLQVCHHKNNYVVAQKKAIQVTPWLAPTPVMHFFMWNSLYFRLLCCMQKRKEEKSWK